MRSKKQTGRPELWIVKDILEVYNALEPQRVNREERARLEQRLAELHDELGYEITAMQAVELLWLQ